MKRFWDYFTKEQYFQKFRANCQEHRLNASAAHAAFFIILSFIPSIILLASLLRFANIERLHVFEFLQQIVPKNAGSFSVSIVTAVWSAGRGMMALTQGLQWIAGIKETRNYFVVRLRATLYMLILMLSIITFLLLGVFGNTLLTLISLRFPSTVYVTKIIIDIKNVFLTVYAVVIFTLLYRFVPGITMKLPEHIPGAVLASAGWMLYSYGFSMYIDRFNGFASTYGSMTTMILFMLWLYFGMYITLIGAEINQLLAKRREKP